MNWQALNFYTKWVGKVSNSLSYTVFYISCRFFAFTTIIRINLKIIIFINRNVSFERNIIVLCIPKDYIRKPNYYSINNYIILA